MKGYSGAALVVLSATVAWLMVQVPTLQDHADSSTATANKALTKVSEVEAQVNANAKALNEANARLIALGKTPVAIPKPQPSTPPVQVDEFTAEEAAAVRLIVADQLSRQKVTITQAEVSQIARVAAQLVPKPVDGKTPTAAQIQPVVTAAVAAYCTGDKCVGKAGQVGPKGDRGPDGPKVTDEELLKASQQALTAYCAGETSPCDGKVGPSGTDGADAPVMVDMDCIGDDAASYWRMQFNKGPDRTAMGPCRIGPEPDN
jgi:hypothetical protein